MSCSCSHGDYTGPWWAFPPLRNAIIAGLIAGTSFLLILFGIISRPIEDLLYWIAIPIGAWYWAQEGIEELVKDHEVNISMLMIAATAGSGILGMWEEAAALVVLYGAAEGIEEYTFARTRTAIRALLDLAPKQARLLRDGKEVNVPAEEVRPGDIFIVRPGESVPTDGIIIDGASSLDESAVTGESVPVDKETGMRVFAASINGQGSLTIRATAGFADNTLSRIIHLVEEAQTQKGRAQKWIERFGRIYSPAVLASSALMAMVAWLAGLDMSVWAQRAVILLVAAAPCALVISLPIAMAAGIAGAGKRGILIKGGAHLEHLGIIRIIAFDKTGTLTHGRPRVTDAIMLDGQEDTLLSIATGLEQLSEHPLARAVLHYGKEKHIRPARANGFTALTGAGAKAEINGRTWYIGNPDLFAEMGNIPIDVTKRVKRLQAEGKTVILLGNEDGIRAIFALQDTLREDAVDVITRLHAMGIWTVMLTGDNIETAKRVAERLHIDEVHAGLRPDEKVEAIHRLMKKGPVLMVGDGINDAPALAAATCGVAMGAAGSDAAIEAADIALMADDLDKLIEALHLGKKAKQVSLENIVFAITVLAILIPAGVGGFITIATAVLIHEATELMAVANGLRAGHP